MTHIIITDLQRCVLGCTSAFHKYETQLSVCPIVFSDWMLHGAACHGAKTAEGHQSCA